MNRRVFLISSGASAVTAAGANDRLRVACVGLRGQGRQHMQRLAALPNVEVAALCDVDDSILSTRAKEHTARTGRQPNVFKDFRKLLEDKSIDAVSLATPNHHHTLQTIWACQAGKDVYVEKPCSHNVFESQQIVAAARKYGRIVQHGTNSRSTVALREAVDKLRTGVIGEVYMARGVVFGPRDTIGRTPVEAVPAGVDYDLWLGPAPARPFTKNRFHYTWHWFWDYGNGNFGNQGIHELDICRWGLGVTYPTKVCAIGGHFMFDDDQETPNTLNVACEFDVAGKKKMIVFDVRHWITNFEAGIGEGKPGGAGNIFYGSNGYMAVDWYDKYTTFIGKEKTPGPSRFEGGNPFANFADAVRSRDRGLLNAEIEEGAISCTLMHLGNISYRLGRSITFDGASMTCPGDKEANAMFRRRYRAPFVVPERV